VAPGGLRPRSLRRCATCKHLKEGVKTMITAQPLIAQLQSKCGPLFTPPWRRLVRGFSGVHWMLRDHQHAKDVQIDLLFKLRAKPILILGVYICSDESSKMLIKFDENPFFLRNVKMAPTCAALLINNSCFEKHM